MLHHHQVGSDVLCDLPLVWCGVLGVLVEPMCLCLFLPEGLSPFFGPLCSGPVNLLLIQSFWYREVHLWSRIMSGPRDSAAISVMIGAALSLGAYDHVSHLTYIFM